MKSLDNRMKKNYENKFRIKLLRKIPVIIRIDGKNFHRLTKDCKRPFDQKFSDTMNETAQFLCENIQGSKCCYVQSDEISILLTDFDRIETSAWFDYNIQKMASISASMASVIFTERWKTRAFFDSRTFNIPKEEVCNYFIWRQKDWIRNSLSMLARAHFSHNQLHKKNSSDMHEMLHIKGINWADLYDHWKNGIFLEKNNEWSIVPSPIFTQDRYVIEKYLT